MNQQDPTQVHCYTNPSFCRQSEYIPDDPDLDLPPPPQFQVHINFSKKKNNK